MTRIYLDNQATTPMDPRVADAMTNAGFGNPHSSEHANGWEAAAKIDLARAEVASLVGADPDEIVFTSGATEANNLAILGIRKLSRQGKNRVFRSTIEHKSVLAACDALSEEYGFVVGKIAVDREGFVPNYAVEMASRTDTALISIVAVNNEIGVIQDIAGIRTASSGTLLHLDAAQAPQAIDLSTLARVCDMASLSAHKMGGPMGIGALYIARHIQHLIAPILFGGGQQAGIRPGTLPLPLCVGMGVAASIAREGTNQRARTAQMRNLFLDHLRTEGIEFEVNGPSDFSRRHPGNANIRIQADASQVIAMLQPGLSVSTGSACTSGSIEPSYVLTEIGLSPEQAARSVRFSIGPQTTPDQIRQAASMVKAALSRAV